jgi:hypothetical protein
MRGLVRTGGRGQEAAELIAQSKLTRDQRGELIPSWHAVGSEVILTLPLLGPTA